MTNTPSLRSVSDDDLCIECTQCKLDDLHGLGVCRAGWPGRTDADGCVVACAQFVPLTLYRPDLEGKA